MKTSYAFTLTLVPTHNIGPTNIISSSTSSHHLSMLCLHSLHGNVSILIQKGTWIRQTIT